MEYINESVLSDTLCPEEIRVNLKTNIIGSEIVYYPSIGSTNDEAKKMANEGCQEGTLVIAEHQTGGRGRKGRTWDSPFGMGICASIVLRPQISPLKAAGLTLVTAVSTCRALKLFTGLPVKIKWPNDIRINHKKIGGILTELNVETGSVNHAVVGIGINVNNKIFPDELKQIATSLVIESGNKTEFNRALILCSILNEFECDYKAFVSGHLEDLLNEWRGYSDTLGSIVQVVGINNSHIEGKAVDIDNDGALLIEKKDGTIIRVISGDVSIKDLGSNRK